MAQLIPFPQGRNQDLVRQLVGFLGDRMRNVAQNRIQALAEELAGDLERGGGQAIQGIRASIRSFVEDGGQRMNGALRAWMGELERSVQEFGDSVRNHIEEGAERGREIQRQQDAEMADDVPDLSDLIPENTQQGTHQEMEVDADGESTQLQARVASSGGNGPVSKETPVSNYPSLSYGLQETHTTILPWTGWISCFGFDKNEATQLKIRMNTPWDMLDVSMGTTPASGNQPGSAKAFYAVPLDSGAKFNTGAVFPTAFSSNSTEATERPAWRDFWASLYDYYTVLGCEYKIIIQNPVELNGQRAQCAVQFDTYSDSATSTGNVMPVTKYENMRTFKNIKWYTIKETSSMHPDHNIAIIEGTYKPGQAKRNIVNDGDVKTWTSTNTASPVLPNLKEILTLNFFLDPLAYNATATTTALNIEVNLRYIVQFKDLKQQARYPNPTITDQDITIILNESATSAGTALPRWA